MFFNLFYFYDFCLYFTFCHYFGGLNLFSLFYFSNFYFKVIPPPPYLHTLLCKPYPPSRPQKYNLDHNWSNKHGPINPRKSGENFQNGSILVWGKRVFIVKVAEILYIDGKNNNKKILSLKTWSSFFFMLRNKQRVRAVFGKLSQKYRRIHDLYHPIGKQHEFLERILRKSHPSWRK